MTRQDRLARLVHERKRLMERIAKASERHKSTRDLRARLVDATRKQIAAELRTERRAA